MDHKLFVAINYISCDLSYTTRFEELFATRAGAIDRMPGFISMQVLKSQKEGDPYLIMSIWENEIAFKGWMSSPEFIEGHKRGFEDIKKAKERGEAPPMRSEFKTYRVIAR